MGFVTLFSVVNPMKASWPDFTLNSIRVVLSGSRGNRKRWQWSAGVVKVQPEKEEKNSNENDSQITLNLITISLETWFYGSRLGLVTQRSRSCLGLEVQRSRSRKRLLYRDHKTWKKNQIKKEAWKKHLVGGRFPYPQWKNDVFRVEKYLTRKILGLGLALGLGLGF